jgi:hypothetical protein
LIYRLVVEMAAPLEAQGEAHQLLQRGQQHVLPRHRVVSRLSRTQTVVATLLVATTVASCSGKHSTSIKHPASNPSSHPSKSAESPSATGITQVALGRNVGPAAVSNDAVVFPAGTAAGAWNRVDSVPLTGGSVKAVAHTQFPGGFINWVAASPDGWIYYVDQSAKQSDGNPRVLWRVVAVDPKTGDPKTLASNGGTPDPYVPIILSQDGWAFWTSAEADKTAREQIWKPGWDKPRDVLRHVEMTPGSESLTGDSLVYLGKASTGATGHTVGGDCWSVPLDGGTPQPLTHTALAMSCGASGDWVVWTQHIGPKDPVPADDGVLDDPYGLWAAKGSEAPRLLHRGYFSSARPYVAGSIVVWSAQDGQRVIQSLAGSNATTTVPGHSAVLPAVGNGKVVVMTSATGKKTVARVVAVPAT